MDKPLSPYEFLKTRRPDKFSDSVTLRQAELGRDFFDFYLDGLTSRSQEKQFELFCKRMAELEICPNLSPQTGPTGGGDSKVDSETYPVSDAHALSWYGGIGREAASERWAFTISAKKDWKAKIKADIANVISTGRDYKMIFFMSNQSISDKKKAATEDELSAKHGLAIKILDRMWLMDKLFTNHREAVAVEYFGLSDSFLSKQTQGPLDYERKQMIDTLEGEIQQIIADGVQSGALVEKSIQAAILSRELELPYNETIGRFNRASSMADKWGTNLQIKECAYEWAWTLYWWHEDYDEFYKKYCDFEKLIIGGINFYDLERLTNLWMNLFAITNGTPDERNFRAHTETLVAEYERIIADHTRPNASLEARANFVFVKLRLGHDINTLLRDLTSIIAESGGILDFSFSTISNIVEEMAPILQESSEFDQLFETLIAVSSNRKQDTTAAGLLLNRGKQLIDNKPYSAIRCIGRALLKLFKEESKNEFLLALFLLGSACEKVGLLWAARGFHLNAFYISFTNYMKYGRVNPIMLACSKSIKNLELRNGRVPQAMEWHNLDNIARGLLLASGYDAAKIGEIEEKDLFDPILGMLFFRVPFEELHQLTLLPEFLEKNNLFRAACALKYSLGYIDKEILDAENGDESAVDNFMTLWYNQPAKDQIAKKANLGLENVEYLQSKILGCQIRITADRHFPCVELAESILAALESFLAAGPLDKMICISPKIDIEIKFNPADKLKISHKKNNDELFFSVYCSDYKQEDFKNAQTAVKEFIFGFIAELVAHTVVSMNITEQLESMAKEDHIFSRSLDFTGSIFIIADLLGKDTISIAKFISPDLEEYPLIRSSPVELKLMAKEGHTKNLEPQRITHEIPEPDAFDPEAISHKNIDIVSVINIPLWNKAKWKGMQFALYPDDGVLVLSPMFTVKNASIAIFDEWVSMVGHKDNKDIIKIGIIKGVDKNHPPHYKVIFTANFEALKPAGNNGGYFITPNRFLKMTPVSDTNLSNFEKELEETGRKYFLIPSYIDPQIKEPELLWSCAILKQNIEIKNAWEVGENSWFSPAITPDDDPLIPPFVMDAPVSKVLKRFHRIN